MNVNFYVIKEYENETVFRLEQNKPNQTQSQNPTPTASRELVHGQTLKWRNGQTTITLDGEDAAVIERGSANAKEGVWAPQ